MSKTRIGSHNLWSLKPTGVLQYLLFGMNLKHLLLSVVSLIVIMVNSNGANPTPANNIDDTSLITSRDAAVDDKSNLMVN